MVKFVLPQPPGLLRTSVRAHVIGHVRDLDLPAAAGMSHLAIDYVHRSV